MNASSDMVHMAFDLIRITTYFTQANKFYQFMSNIFLACEYRPTQIQVYSNIVALYINAKKMDDQDSYKECMIRWALYSHLENKIDEKHYCLLIFLKHCLNINLITLDQLVIAINHFWQTCQNRRYHLIRIFTVFAPNIQKVDGVFFMHLYSTALYESASGNLPIQYQSFIDSIEKLKENDWAYWDEISQTIFPLETPENCIRRDDLEKLKKLSFDANKRVEPNVFDPCWLIQFYPTLIEYAAYFGSVNCFSYLLLEKKADISLKDYKNKSLAEFTCAGGSIEIFDLLKHYNVDYSKAITMAVKFHQYNLFSHLYRTIEKREDYFDSLITPNNVRAFKMLIENRQIPQNVYNLVYKAAKKGSYAVLQMLLSFGNKNELNMLNKEGDSPLHASVKNGNLTSIKVLVSLPNVDVNAPNGHGYSPLIIAAKNCNRDAVALLLTVKNIDVNTKDRFGNSLLHIAALKNSVEIVRLLVNDGRIDPNTANEDGDYPIHIAVRNPDSSGTHFMRIVSITDPREEQRLKAYIREQNRKVNIDLLTALCDHPRIDVNVRSGTQMTALHYISRYGHHQNFNVLKKNPKLDINARNDKGRTPFHIAAEDGRLDMIKTLLNEDDIEANAIDIYGQTPLHRSVFAGCPELTHYLMQHPKIDLNVQDRFGRTPLIIAAIKNRVANIKSLAVSPRIDLNIRDKEGLTAEMHAVKNKRKFITDLLRLAAAMPDHNDE